MSDTKILCFSVGELATNCYLIGDPNTHEAVIIDPGGTSAELMAACDQWNIQQILLTHGHADHIAGISAVRQQDTSILLAKADQTFYENPRQIMGTDLNLPPVDGELNEGDDIEVGALKLKVHATPGHSPGSVIFANSQIAFTGDTLFRGSVGRYDLPGGSEEALMASLDKILTVLSDETTLYPGHGPQSTLKEEKSTNPFLIMRQQFGSSSQR